MHDFNLVNHEVMVTYSYKLHYCSFLVFFIVYDELVGGPKLRKWYGAPDMLSKDGGQEEDEENSPGTK